MVTVIQYAVYLALRVVETLLKLLPLETCCVIGEIAGWIFYLSSPSYRRLVYRNVCIAFEGELGKKELQSIARKHFVRLGCNIVSSIKIAMMPASEIEERVTYEGLEHLNAATANGRGMIAAVSHFGNWELLAQLPKLFPTPDRATMFQSLGNPFVNKHVVQSRSKTGITLFDRDEGIFGPLKYIREGGGVAILFDQHAGDSGTWVPLFGRLASTTRLPALMAIKSKVALIAIAVHTTERGRWRVVIRPPIEPDEPVPSGSNRAAYLTLRLNQAIEQLIRLAPAEWFWVHNRWKTPNPDFLLGARKRDLLALDTSLEDEAQATASAKMKPFRLLVRSPNPLGDACMAIPAVRAMKRRSRPDLELTVLCRENLRPVWERVSEVDRVITIGKNSFGSVGRVYAAECAIRKSAVRFDAAVLLPNSLSSAVECKLAGIPRIVGDRGHSRSWLLNQIVPAREIGGSAEHHANFYLNIAAHCGAYIGTRDPFPVTDLAVVDSDRPAADNNSSVGPRVIGLCPGAEYGDAKRWPLEEYAKAVLAVAEGYKDDSEAGCQFHIFGSPNEAELGAQLAEQIATVSPTNRVGQTSIDELCDALTACDVVLTNDTGTMHLAAALGTPTVAIFGSTEPALTAPLGTGHTVIRRHVECSPCFLRECPRDYRCMHEIDGEKVVAAVLATLPAR